jgi:hypothetical protein
MDNNFSFETGDEEASPFLTGMAMTYITCHLGCQEEELLKIYVIPLLLAMSIFWPPEGKKYKGPAPFKSSEKGLTDGYVSGETKKLMLINKGKTVSDVIPYLVMEALCQ